MPGRAGNKEHGDLSWRRTTSPTSKRRLQYRSTFRRTLAAIQPRSNVAFFNGIDPKRPIAASKSGRSTFMPAYLGRSPAAASGSRNDSVEDSVCAIRRPEPRVAVQVEGGAVLVDHEFGHELHLAVTLQPSNRLAHCLLCRDIATICVGSFVPVFAEHLARLLSQFL